MESQARASCVLRAAAQSAAPDDATRAQADPAAAHGPAGAQSDLGDGLHDGDTLRRPSGAVPKQIVNDVAARDIWPVLAKAVGWGYGASGTFGFGSAGVKDRYHDFRHSDYFSAGFIKAYVAPLVLQGKTVSAPPLNARAPWYISVLEIIPLKLLLPISIVGGFVKLAVEWRQVLQMLKDWLQ